MQRVGGLGYLQIETFDVQTVASRAICTIPEVLVG
jgi:hypothetical protein